MPVRSLASLSGLRIQYCRELWWRLQTQLRSDVAVAVAVMPAALAPIGSLAWEPPYAVSMALKGKKKKKKKKKKFSGEQVNPQFSPG